MTSKILCIFCKKILYRLSPTFLINNNNLTIIFSSELGQRIQTIGEIQSAISLQPPRCDDFMWIKNILIWVTLEWHFRPLDENSRCDQSSISHRQYHTLRSALRHPQGTWSALPALSPAVVMGVTIYVMLLSIVWLVTTAREQTYRSLWI